MMYHGREPGKIWYVRRTITIQVRLKCQNINANLLVHFVVTCAMILWHKCSLWVTSTLAVRSLFLRPAPDSFLVLWWRGWEVVTLLVYLPFLIKSILAFSFCTSTYHYRSFEPVSVSPHYVNVLCPSLRLWLSDSGVSRWWADQSRHGEFRFSVILPWDAARFSNV